MDEKTYLERKQLREKLEALPQWSDILRYADSRCSQAVATHDSRLSESDTVYKKAHRGLEWVKAPNALIGNPGSTKGYGY